MNGYFRPLRRRLGVFTLAMACVLAVVWLLGRDRVDFVTLNFLGHRWNVVTGCGSVQIVSGWLSSQSVEYIGLNPPEAITQTLVISQQPLNDMAFRMSWLKWTATIVLIRTTLDNVHGNVVTPVPYWSIVIPLTMLSVYMLLSKPRPNSGPNQSAAKVAVRQNA